MLKFFDLTGTSGGACCKYRLEHRGSLESIYIEILEKKTGASKVSSLRSIKELETLEA